MNRERELLRKILDETNYINYACNDKIRNEIQELLAQPEQEPDYYLWHDEVHEEHPTNEGDPDVYPLYLTPPKPEQTEQEPVAWMYDWNIIEEEEYGETRYDNLTRAESITKSRAITNVRPLYTTPPKREPLSDEGIEEWCQYNNIRALEKLRFQQGVIFAEKKHGIGG